MFLRCLVALFALVACILVISVAPPASAQTREDILKRRPPAPKGGNALYAWCRQSVFLRYGFEGQNPYMNLERKGRVVFMSDETAFSQTEHCVRMRGEGY